MPAEWLDPVWVFCLPLQQVKSWPVPMYRSRPSELDSEDTVTTFTPNSSLTVTYLVLWPSRGCCWVPFVIGCLDFNWRQDRHRRVVSSTNERTWTCQSVRWRGSMLKSPFFGPWTTHQKSQPKSKVICRARLVLWAYRGTGMCQTTQLAQSVLSLRCFIFTHLSASTAFLGWITPSQRHIFTGR